MAEFIALGLRERAVQVGWEIATIYQQGPLILSKISLSPGERDLQHLRDLYHNTRELVHKALLVPEVAVDIQPHLDRLDDLAEMVRQLL